MEPIKKYCMKVMRLNGDLNNSVKDLKGIHILNSMKRKILLSLGLILAGVIARLWLYNIMPSTPHIYITLAGIKQPMFMMDVFFVIAAISLITGRYLGSHFTFIIPLAIMGITDAIIGNTAIFLFTWSGFAMMAAIGYTSRGHGFTNFFGRSIFAVITYDIWTNFGSWLGWYNHDLNGLLLCYTLAIPFMLWHLLSTMLLLPVMAMPLERLQEHEYEMISKKAVVSPIMALMAVSIISLL